MRSSDQLNARGHTLVELLVGLTVVLAIMATAMTFALSSRKIYEADRARVDLNQNLRAAMDFMAADIRQAGERLGAGFPAIEILDGDTGPDQLIVRRNLLDTVLRVCEDLSSGDSTITVGTPSGLPSGCAEVADDDGDGMPENIDRWRDAREAAGGAIVAYVYDSIDDTGDFFVYKAEDGDALTITSESTGWSKTYSADDQCRIYLLEEHRYELHDGVLQFFLNGDTARPRKIVDDIVGLSLTAHFQDGSNAPFLDANDNWRTLRAIEVAIDGSIAFRNRTVDRSWSSEIMPRNVMSR